MYSKFLKTLQDEILYSTDKNEATTDWGTLKILAYNLQGVLKLYFVLPEDGILVLKHVGDTPLIFIYN